MSSMCFATAVNKRYDEYVPWFIYYNSLAYPDCHTYVMLDHEMTPELDYALEAVRGFGNWEVRPCAFGPDFVNVNALTIKYLRWLAQPEMVMGFDCVSIGDVDMAYCRETPSYADQHLSHCKRTGLPYSNFIRPGRPVLGGINVVKPREWYKVMGPTLDKYIDILRRKKMNFDPPSQNEKLLFTMIAESELGTPPADLTETYHSCLASSNHHGVHIRNMELNSTEGLKGARKHENHKQNILKSVKTDRFSMLSARSPRIGDIMRNIAEFYRTI